MKIYSLLLLSFCCFLAPLKAGKTKEPDYTKGDKLKGRLVYWNLGATGAVGNIWSVRAVEPTHLTRTIQVREIFKESPAEGQLVKDDVILGVIFPKLIHGIDKKNYFSDNAPKILSHAITEAEKEHNGGRLVLNVWRQGKIMPVTLKLKVKGTFSKTAPFNCPKTALIIEEAAQSILDSKRLDPKARHVNLVSESLNALGLLATGEKKYWKTVRDFILRFKDGIGSNSWKVAYFNMLTCEYYLCTGDKDVLPMIENMSNTIAGGRSAVGTWSHGMANPIQNDGKPFGMPGAYGAMNQVTVTLGISLVLAQKCGIKNELIDTAVEKTANYLRFYVDKGSIPYGDHQPGPRHDNNGSSSQAAVLFNLLGDKEATKYFTRMSLASEKDREAGHTGPFFSRLWGPLGAACGGKIATVEFNRMTRWMHELQRRHNGELRYLFSLNSRDEHGKYRDWRVMGARMLEYCLPRRQLYINGKGGYVLDEFSQFQVNEIMLTPRINLETIYKQAILKQLQHWSPLVRRETAKKLIDKDLDLNEDLLKMLSGGNRYGRYGACLALKYSKAASEKEMKALIETGLNAKESTMRYFAIQGMIAVPEFKKENIGMSPYYHLTVPALFKLINTDYKDEYRSWTRTYAAFSLFNRGRAAVMSRDDWAKISLEEKINAIRKILKSDDGNARSAVSRFFQDLNEKEVALLLPDIYQAVKKSAPSGVMFGKEVRSNGLTVLAKNHIKEGIELGIYYMLDEPGHGRFEKKIKGMKAMRHYGQALEKYLPRLNEVFKNEKKRYKKDFESFMKIPRPELVSMQEFINKVLNSKNQNTGKNE